MFLKETLNRVIEAIRVLLGVMLTSPIDTCITAHCKSKLSIYFSGFNNSTLAIIESHFYYCFQLDNRF